MPRSRAVRDARLSPIGGGTDETTKHRQDDGVVIRYSIGTVTFAMPEPTQQRGAARSSYLSVSFKAVAIAATVFGFSCLVVLVISTTIDNADSLATVALALAILAFTMQLIVFVAEEAAGREQSRRNEELHGLMRGVLAEIREKASGTQADVRMINEKLLESFLAKSLSDAKAAPGGINYEQLAGEVSAVLQLEQPAFQDAATRQAPAPTLPYPPRRPTPDDAQILAQLETYPRPDEVGQTLKILQSLASKSRRRLCQFGEDELRSRTPGSPYDPGLSDLYTEELTERGLIEPVDGYVTSVDGSPIMHLTDLGRETARLLTARGKPPAYLEELDRIRAALSE
jgi:hypothetical protein